jgi:hypothetical protein
MMRAFLVIQSPTDCQNVCSVELDPAVTTSQLRSMGKA